MGEPETAGGRPVDAEVRRRLRGFAYRLTGDGDLADDVAQETVARVLAEGAPTDLPYLFRVALNLVRTEARRARRRPVAEEADRVADTRSPGPLDLLVTREEGTRLWRALGSLPERERTALVLRYGEGLSCTEIARTLGGGPNAVSCLLHRAKERMRSLLAPRSVTP